MAGNKKGQIMYWAIGIFVLVTLAVVYFYTSDVVQFSKGDCVAAEGYDDNEFEKDGVPSLKKYCEEWTRSCKKANIIHTVSYSRSNPLEILAGGICIDKVGYGTKDK